MLINYAGKMFQRYLLKIGLKVPFFATTAKSAKENYTHKNIQEQIKTM